VQPPVLAGDGNWTTTGDLFYSWNGATDVFAYEVYAGTALNAFHLIDIQPRTGFETHSDVSEQTDVFCFFQVRAVRKNGDRSEVSNTVMAESCITAQIYLPIIYQ
jgi:hypothetical protein